MFQATAASIKLLRIAKCDSHVAKYISSTSRCYSEMKEKRHSGKVAVVTASTEGIGLAIAQKLAQDGASVVISSRKEKNVEKALKDLQNQGLDVVGTTCHVSKSEDRKALIDFALSQKGGIDYFISNAGTNPVPSLILDTSEEVWDKLFDINVKAAFMLTKEIVPHITKRGGGSIVYVSSVTAFKAVPILGAYSVSKTALLGMTRAVADQCGPLGIRVNCIAPGIINTKFSSMLTAAPEAEQKIAGETIVGRTGEAVECGGIVSFLCSDEASYITGENIPVTGGMFCRL